MTPDDAKALREPFDPSLVQVKQGRGNPRYVGHAYVTDRLLAVDPEWTWEPMATDITGQPILDVNEGLWINLTVCGVTRPGYGTPERANQGGDGVKQAISDAIKVAAMRFGVALDLWQKDDTGQTAEGDEWVPPDHDRTAVVNGGASNAQLGMIRALLKDKRGISERDAILAYCGEAVGRVLTSSKDLSKQEASQIINELQ